MYEMLSRISGLLSGPFTSIVYTTDIAIFAALILGIVGALAPCQISANLGALSFYGNRHLQKLFSPWEVAFYIAGKMFVFSAIGIIFWLFGESVSNQSIPFFVWARKMMGPLFIFIGLYLLKWIRLPGNIGQQASQSLERFAQRLGGNWGSFLMGVAFSLGFCPTMFWLFFGLLMPLTFGSSVGFFLPSLFAIGTAIPLFIIFGLYFGFGLDKIMLKKLKKWGGLIQKATGIFFIVWGISDTFTYWTL